MVESRSGVHGLLVAFFDASTTLTKPANKLKEETRDKRRWAGAWSVSTDKGTYHGPWSILWMGCTGQAVLAMQEQTFPRLKET